MKIGKWKIKIGLVKPFEKGKHWCYDFLLNLILFTINVTDLYGIIVICNVRIKWEKYFK